MSNASVAKQLFLARQAKNKKHFTTLTNGESEVSTKPSLIIPPNVDHIADLSQMIKYNYTCSRKQDVMRISLFLDTKYFPFNGVNIVAEERVPVQWTRDNIIVFFTKDLIYAHSKAIHKKGIQSATMFDILLMWEYALNPNRPTPEYSNFGIDYILYLADKYDVELVTEKPIPVEPPTFEVKDVH